MVVSVALIAAGASGVAAQVELDRILTRVNGRAITQSDVRQARALKLVDDVSSDAAAQRALEDRMLILTEMNRAAAVAPPSDAEIAAHRQSWAAGLGGGANVDALLARNGMSSDDLQTWLRDDLRIRAYLARQFGTIPEADRAKATNDWLVRLRQRAEGR
jgi:hypothetical protein